jgi:hypothetical protein
VRRGPRQRDWGARAGEVACSRVRAWVHPGACVCWVVQHGIETGERG